MSSIETLITEFSRLPGIGRKTAQRLTFHLLAQQAGQARALARALDAVAERVRACEICGNLTEEQPCAICRDPRRDAALLCVVEEPSRRLTALARKRCGLMRSWSVSGAAKSVKSSSPPTLLWRVK